VLALCCKICHEAGLCSNAAATGSGLALAAGASPVLHELSGGLDFDSNAATTGSGLAPQACASLGSHNLSDRLDPAANAAPAGSGLAPQACASPGLHNLSDGLDFPVSAATTGSGFALQACASPGLLDWSSGLDFAVGAATKGPTGVTHGIFAATASQVSAGIYAPKRMHPETLAQSAPGANFRCNAVRTSPPDATVLADAQGHVQQQGMPKPHNLEAGQAPAKAKPAAATALPSAPRPMPPQAQNQAPASGARTSNHAQGGTAQTDTVGAQATGEPAQASAAPFEHRPKQAPPQKSGTGL
jgi:hypothetical protein